MSPEAIVETISFGTPTGSARIAAVAIAVFPDPPAARTPWQRPSSNSRRTTTGAAAHIASTAGPRSVSAGEVEPARGGQLLARTSGSHARWPLRADVDERATATPGLAEPVAEERELLPLGVERADEDDGRRTRGVRLAAVGSRRSRSGWLGTP